MIGGQAEMLHGSSRVTVDINICPRRTPANLARLASALKPLNPRLRDAPPGVSFVCDGFALENSEVLTLSTEAMGDIDVIGEVVSLGGFERLLPRALEIEFDSCAVRIMALDDLIAVKRHLSRPKDLHSLMHLLGLKGGATGTGPEGGMG